MLAFLLGSWPVGLLSPEIQQLTRATWHLLAFTILCRFKTSTIWITGPVHHRETSGSSTLGGHNSWCSAQRAVRRWPRPSPTRPDLLNPSGLDTTHIAPSLPSVPLLTRPLSLCLLPRIQ